MPTGFGCHHGAMAEPPAYELIDAGDGRRLERFADRIVDRPAASAEEPRRDPAAWAAADLRFDRYRGWSGPAAHAPDAGNGASVSHQPDDAGGTGRPWLLDADDLRFELRPTATGQVGLFPEQAPLRAWLRTALADAADEEAPTRLLNLFAYTGAASLAAAAEGAHVGHVDGSRPTVAWARRNAELSGLAERPIRWIVDDAEVFARRELRRDRRWDAVVLDPPSYGHGSRRAAGAWRLEDRLAGLLDSCAELTGGDPVLALLTAHTPGFGPDRLAAELAAAFGRRPADVEAGELGLRARSGAHLRLGAWARIIRG